MSRKLTLQPTVGDETAEHLRALAAQTGRSESELAADALEAYVAHETEFRRLVEEGLRDLDEGRVVDHETVMADFAARRIP